MQTAVNVNHFFPESYIAYIRSFHSIQCCWWRCHTWRCGKNLRPKVDTVINSLSANHACLRTLYSFLQIVTCSGVNASLILGDDLPLPFSPAPLLFPPFPTLPRPPPFPPLPLEAGPLNPARGVWRALLAPPAGSGAESQPKSNLVHFSLKIRHLVAKILMILVKSQLTKKQVVYI